MPDFPPARVLLAVERLRAEIESPPAAPIVPEVALPRRYPVACVLLPALGVAAMRAYLDQRGAALPAYLVACRDRRLRGGIVAWQGYGMLFADADDSEAERRFTLAHEGKHYLMEHLFPRLDLLARFGPTLQPVLDGLRAPTRDERVDALLAHTALAQQTHLMERDANGSPERDALEDDADAFACELIAPGLALKTRFPNVRRDEESVAEVCAALTNQFALPPAPALAYARRWVTARSEPVTLLQRLRLV